jgi:hypothetical protein
VSAHHHLLIEAKLPKSSIGRYAPLMGAPILPSKKECALSMGQSVCGVALKDAQVMLKREECVLNMGQSECGAAVKDARIMSSTEDCA